MIGRALIEADQTLDGINIWLADRTPDGILITHGPGGERTVIRPGESAVRGAPTITLPDHMATALLDALAAHYRRATEQTTVRADLEREQARVDGLIAVVSRIAETATGPVRGVD
jgi:hypothetical protein